MYRRPILPLATIMAMMSRLTRRTAAKVRKHLSVDGYIKPNYVSEKVAKGFHRKG